MGENYQYERIRDDIKKKLSHILDCPTQNLVLIHNTSEGIKTLFEMV